MKAKLVALIITIWCSTASAKPLELPIDFNPVFLSPQLAMSDYLKRRREEDEAWRNYLEESERLNREEWQRADQQALENIRREEERKAREAEEQQKQENLTRMQREDAKRRSEEMAEDRKRKQEKQEELKTNTNVQQGYRIPKGDEEKSKHSEGFYLGMGAVACLFSLFCIAMNVVLGVIVFLLLLFIPMGIFDVPKPYGEGVIAFLVFLCLIGWVWGKFDSKKG